MFPIGSWLVFLLFFKILDTTFKYSVIWHVIKNLEEKNLRKVLKYAPLMAFLAVSMLLTNIVAVAANPGLDLDQGDEIDYELTEVTSGLNYFNMTGDTSGFANPIDMSEGDEMTFTLAVVTEEVLVHGIEAYDPANNFSNTYTYNASDLAGSVTYVSPLPAIWYDSWFAYNLFYDIYYSNMHFIPWVLTTDWDDHEDSWNDLAEDEQGMTSTFGNVTDITADVDDKTFTMEAKFNATRATEYGETLLAGFDGEIAYKVVVEYADDGHCVKQDITMRDLYVEIEDGEYSSVHMVWEEKEGLPLLYIAIPIVAVVVAVAVYLVLKK